MDSDPTGLTNIRQTVLGLSHLGVGVNSVDDSDDAVDFSIGSEDAHDALVTLVREWRLKEHFLVDGTVLGEVGNDGVDEPHLVRCEGA